MYARLDCVRDGVKLLGVDLGWYGRPSGVAAMEWNGRELKLLEIGRIDGHAEVLKWVAAAVGNGDGVVGVDAPLVIRNASGTRISEQALNREFRKYHAGCHAANLGLPFAKKVLGFSAGLEEMGFTLNMMLGARSGGRYQIEVHPHAASVKLFGLDRIVKYKRGLRAERAKGLRQLRSLMTERFGKLEPAVEVKLPAIPRVGDLKPVEDRIDAVMCAYIAAHWWFWGAERNGVYGTEEDGYVVVPAPAAG